MEILNKVKEILNDNPFSYIYTDGYKNVYDLLKAHPELKYQFVHHEISDFWLMDRYVSHIPNGYYGFSVGTPIIPAWMKIIDEILEYCVKVDPNLEIRAIKLKFGGIDFHVLSNVITDMHEVFRLLTTTLRDKALIY